MPYQSDAQRRFMHAKHPDIAARWDREYPNQKDLPEHKRKDPMKHETKMNALHSLLGKYMKKRDSSPDSPPASEPDEMERKRSDLRSQIHKTIDVLDEHGDLESVLTHARGVAAECLKKKSGSGGEK